MNILKGKSTVVCLEIQMCFQDTTADSFALFSSVDVTEHIKGHKDISPLPKFMKKNNSKFVKL